ncbi:TRAP transporter small permease [Phaeovulum sp.]|uniref:TRAP transporter small permease n=1 Tax=Phaeovulum sp. TaxID=2934796 RepID=UPI002730DA26|nr:TRAP transporter small permease [Phaeovulum sp.]MDP1670097.1 TRAP transporter small permease [Phaeovulum sp.]MDZ4118339.1 TRAP transporter small permease [Phaeovulum sp.]
MNRALAAIDAVEKALIAALAATALLLACAAMTARYLLPSVTLDWAFDLTIFVTIWATFLAGARTAGQGGHVRVDTALAILPARLRFLLIVAAGVAGIALALFLLWSGALVVEQAHRWGERTSSTLRLPLWIYYLSLPVGAFLLAFHLAVRTTKILAGKVRDELGKHEF